MFELLKPNKYYRAVAMASLVTDVLKLIASHNEITSTECAAILKQDHQKIVGAVKSILCFPQVRVYVLCYCWI